MSETLHSGLVCAEMKGFSQQRERERFTKDHLKILKEFDRKVETNN